MLIILHFYYVVNAFSLLFLDNGSFSYCFSNVCLNCIIIATIFT